MNISLSKYWVFTLSIVFSSVISTDSVFCVFDFKLFYDFGKYDLIEFSERFSWNCLDSYIIGFDSLKLLAVSFSNIKNDCPKNNLEITDYKNNIYDYCKSKMPKNYLYISKNPSWIRIRRTKYCYFCSAPISFSFELSNKIPSFFDYNNCGIRSSLPRSILNIVEESDALPNSWPWQVFLSDESINCGGSVINNEWILTAAHCFVDISKLKAYLGFNNISFIDDPSQGSEVIEVVKEIPHPEYDPDYALNDIKLLKLARPITLSEKIKPICLPSDKIFDIGDILTVTGWGDQIENETITPILQEVNVTVKNNILCGIVAPTKLCAGDPSRGICKGDSGGPLVRYNPITEQYWQVGIVSFFYDGCATFDHKSYTNVAEYMAWIADNIHNDNYVT